MITADQFIVRVFEQSGVTVPPKVKLYGDVISPHLDVGSDVVWSPDTHEVSLIPQEISLFEEARVNQWAKVIGVDAGYRTHAHELVLQAKGYKTAKFVSPHTLGTALDCRVLPGTEPGETQSAANTLLRRGFREAADVLKIPQPRIGHRAYNEVFCHVDLMFLLFDPYTKLAHPKDWTDLDPALRNIFAAALRPGYEW